MFRRTFTTVARAARSAAARPAAGAGMVAVAAAPVAARVAGGRMAALLPAAAALGVAAAFAVSDSAHAAGVDYDKVREEISNILDKEGYDDGSLGPVLVRLAWHASGTYSVFSKDGGSNGATMRFHPECADGANAGLSIARDALEPVLAKFPGLSRADLWTLAGCVAIEEMGGPKIEWRSGRTDASSGKACPPTGRLPDAARGADHIRAVFYRMGFNDREIVALVGAHAVGRCHTDRSGFDGPWTFSPTTFSNEFFRLMLEETWVPRQWNGPTQFQDKGSRSLMMLPADLALVRDPDFRKYVELYAKDEGVFFKDFASAFSKLLHLGCGGEEKKAGGLCGFC